MSCAIITVVYGVPKNDDVIDKIKEWEQDSSSDKWFENDNGTCGFTDLYSASGDGAGYCGVELDQLESYNNQLISEVRMIPTQEEMQKAQAMVDALDVELKELTGPIGVYFIWSDS